MKSFFVDEVGSSGKAEDGHCDCGGSYKPSTRPSRNRGGHCWAQHCQQSSSSSLELDEHEPVIVFFFLAAGFCASALLLKALCPVPLSSFHGILRIVTEPEHGVWRVGSVLSVGQKETADTWCKTHCNLCSSSSELCEQLRGSSVL